MKDKKISVLVKRTGEPATVVVIDNTLAAKQELVGGMIEIPYNPEFEESGIALVCNEEGKFSDDPKPNVYWGDTDVVYGDIFFTAFDDDGEAISLSPEQIEAAKDFISENDASAFSGDPEAVAAANCRVEFFDNNEDFFKALGLSPKTKTKGSEM